MKKIFGLAVLAVLGSCSNENVNAYFIPGNDAEKLNLRGKPATMMEYEVQAGEEIKRAEYQFDKEGLISLSELKRSNHQMPYPLIISSFYDYELVAKDTMAMVITQNAVPDPEFVRPELMGQIPSQSDTVYLNDKLGVHKEILERHIQNHDNTLNRKEVYDYVYDGSKMLEMEVSINGNQGWRKTTYEYDGDGRVVSRALTYLSERGDTALTTENVVYMGDSIQIEQFDGETLLARSTFDKYFNIVGFFNPNDTTGNSVRVIYEYDDKGNWVRQITPFFNPRSNQVDTAVVKRIYTYH